MPVMRNIVRQDCFNSKATLPYNLPLQDFEMAMQDIYDFFYDINKGLTRRGLLRTNDMVRR